MDTRQQTLPNSVLHAVPQRWFNYMLLSSITSTTLSPPLFLQGSYCSSLSQGYVFPYSLNSVRYKEKNFHGI